MIKNVFIFLTLLLCTPNLSLGAINCVQLVSATPKYALTLRTGVSEIGDVYNSQDRIDYLIEDLNGNTIGEFKGYFDRATDKYDFYFSIHPNFRRLGISQKLLAQFFLKFPKNKKIKSSLIFTNLEVFTEKLEENGGDEWAAALQTPFVRALQAFGYELSVVNFDLENEDEMLSVTLTPNAPTTSSSALD